MTTTTEKIHVQEIAYHRNGVCGEGFFVVTFFDNKEWRFVATLFPTYQEIGGKETYLPSGRCAVLCLDLLPSVTFGTNSWRGDHYESALLDAINQWNSSR
jgi:hypothetical protein